MADSLSPKERRMALQEMLDDILSRDKGVPRHGRVFAIDNSHNCYVLFATGSLSAEEVLELARMAAGLDLYLSFEVRSVRAYSRIQFQHVPRPAEQKALPKPGARTWDRGTRPESPLYKRGK